MVAHEDRLARLGFEFVEHVAARNGCAIMVANQEPMRGPIATGPDCRSRTSAQPPGGERIIRTAQE